MKRRYISALLALTLSLGVATSACAADTGGFADVDAAAWYADAVRYVSEKGLMVGTGGEIL